MGKKLQSSLVTKNNVPGPGNYKVHLKNKPSAPNYGFGSSEREDILKKGQNIPGPGAYRINSTISDLPPYAIPNRPDEYKYIWFEY